MIRIEYYLLIHDVFPENLAALSLLDRNGLRFKILKYIFDWSYEKADQIIVLGRDMYDVVKRKNKKENVTVITNWSQNDALYPENKTNNRLVTEWGLTTKFIVQYAGNIGWAQGIENILQAIKYIDDPDVHFVFIGEGAKLADLLMFKKENPERLTYVKTMPRELQHLFLNACDVSLVCLASGYYGLGVPSKTYNLLAVGKPILLVSEANTEIELTIKEEHVGLFVEANNPEKLADAILRLKNDRALYDSLKRNCIKTANSRFSKKNVLNKYIELLHE